MMREDAFSNSLTTHKLSGKLNEFYASSCGYDCRIIFDIVKNPENSNEEIILY